MNSQEIQNLQEAYLDVYYEDREPGVKPYRPGPTGAETRADAKQAAKKKAESGANKAGYGPEEKFKDWKLTSTPSTVNKKGETISQRMNNEAPYKTRPFSPLFSKQGSRTASAVTRATEGPGEPQSVTMPRKKSREIVRRGQNESYDLYDIVLSHLLDEGYADTYEAAEAIMVNMSEEWREGIVEDIRGAITYNPNTPIGKLKRRIKGSTPEKREQRTRDYEGNRSDAAGRYGASQNRSYDDNTGDIPALRGR